MQFNTLLQYDARCAKCTIFLPETDANYPKASLAGTGFVWNYG